LFSFEIRHPLNRSTRRGKARSTGLHTKEKGVSAYTEKKDRFTKMKKGPPSLWFDQEKEASRYLQERRERKKKWSEVTPYDEELLSSIQLVGGHPRPMRRGSGENVGEGEKGPSPR